MDHDINFKITSQDQYQNPSDNFSTLKTLSSAIPDSLKYSRQAAYGYALQWYNDRNTDHYNDFTGSGGDCANFVSQCLIAGGLSLYKGTDGGGYGVYPDNDRTILSYGAIVYCDYLNLHLRNYQNTSVTYVTDADPTIPEEITIGDVVIFGNKLGDKYQHAMLVVSESGSDIGLAGHTTDEWDGSFATKMASRSCATFYHFNDEESDYFHFKVDTSTLNVRVGPGKNRMTTPQFYQDIGDIHQDEEYIAFETAFDDNGNVWWHFWFDDRTAWCSSSYTINITQSNYPFEVEVTTALNVRDGAGTGYSVFGQIYDGMRFVSDYIDGNWYRFWYSGAVKYAYSSYLSDLEEDDNYIIPSQNNNTVMGFLPYWVNYNQNFTPLTHLAWFSLEMNVDGTIANKHSWPITSLIDNVHAAGRKIVVTATLFNSTEIHTLISTPSYRTTAITNLLNEVIIGNADGICIDFEHPKTTGDDNYLVTFMEELYTTFKSTNSSYHVSLCTPSVDWWNVYDYGELSAYCDALMLMGYGYYYAGSSTAGPTSPLYGGSYNINRSVYDHINGGAPRNRIVLGLPFYGYNYDVEDTTKHSSASSGAAITYTNNLAKISSESPMLYYDYTYQCQWYNYQDAGDWHQVWCENNDSLAVKMDYILDENLGGLGIWAWGYQGVHTELDDLIVEKFFFEEDNEIPYIEIISPTNNSQISTSDFTISWIGTDNEQIYNFLISIDEAPALDIGLNNEYDVNLPNGMHKITVFANDTNNNISNDTIYFIIDTAIDYEEDTEDPIITFLNPENNSIISETDLDISWIGSDNIDIDFYMISIDNNDWEFLGLVNSYSKNFTEGFHKISIQANDTSNNYAISTIFFQINRSLDDFEKPYVFIYSPLNNSIIENSSVIIQFSASDNIKLKNFYIMINNDLEWINIGLNYSYVFNLDNGTYIVFVKAIDMNNNYNTSSILFNISYESGNNESGKVKPTNPDNIILLVISSSSIIIGISSIILIIRKRNKRMFEDNTQFSIKT